jgi:hypothetical protein
MELKIGDKLLIITDRIGNKLLANVELGEVITITGFSEDRKILYHNNSLALPNNNNTIYKKLNNDT